MKTEIEKLIDPKGWVPWNNKSNPPTTITYREYMNYEPGSDVGNRVKWIGYKPKMTDQEAHKYTVDALINHNGWLRHTCVPYNGSL
ncbi:Pectinesterase 3 [Cardamine amara subsp. amara]|uniref:Pectinesterase 3 n=1 Tax=Cardamine amara subsp. amara TaxID=228776 RepID=A0ABD1BQZ3_CARAN